MKSREILRLVILFSVIFSMLAISGCKKEVKECEFNTQCAKAQCFNAKCVENKCVQTPVPNCCGNGICDKTENYCKCQRDCLKDKCEGKALLSDPAKTPKIFTLFLEYKCDKENECSLDYNRTSQREIPLISEKQFDYFKLYIKTTLKRPFDVTSDKIDVEISLKDIANETVIGGLHINKIEFVKNSYLYGSEEIGKDLTKVGDSITVSIPITYDIEKIEVEQNLDIKIDYTYKYYVNKKTTNESKSKNGEILTYPLTEKLYMIKPGDKK
jgi:hypothetical protein